MEMLKGAVGGVGVVLVASGVILMLSPKGGMEKPLKFLCSAVVLSVILSIFSAKTDISLKNYFETGQDIPTDFSEATNYGYEAAAKTALEKLINEVLEKMKITGAEILISMDKSEDGVISFNNVTVLLEKKDTASVSAVYKALSEQIGKDVSVKIQEE